MIDLLTVIGTIAGITALIIGLWIPGRRSRQPTWKDALNAARKVLQSIEKPPAVIIGIGRSGGIWGGWLAGNLGSIPFLVVDDAYEQSPAGRKVTFPGGEQVLSALEEFKEYGDSILIVEGAASTGQTFKEFLEEFSEQLTSWKIKKAVLYKNPAAAIDIEFVGRTLERWPERFPWHEQKAWLRLLRNGSHNTSWS